ncbi:MAG: 4Fe-4S dicluster domain-containing protein [Actinomycetota bacterium]|nr:4Fe-4S dicluster domain-containing protein [Actinomycetota bacterium]MDD5666941.1 4Fe-4S dicluster domain-containing protein [Actinomycetota bacterium]
MANPTDKAILFDASKCTGCRACQVACKNWNQRTYTRTDNNGTYENPLELTSQCWMRILFNEPEKRPATDDELYWYFTKYQCMHCTDATCVKVCPSGATQKYKVSDGDSEAWLVKTDPKKCIGCNYCVATCPFQACRYDAAEKGIFRCIMCFDRITNEPDAFPTPEQAGLDMKNQPDPYPTRNRPACVQTCTTGALDFGTREEMLAKAEDRADYLKQNGSKNAQVYGLDQVGGLHYIYVLEDEPDKYGLPAKPTVPAGVHVWETLVKPGAPWGGLALVGLVAAAGAGYVINKRNEGMERKVQGGGD